MRRQSAARIPTRRTKATMAPYYQSDNEWALNQSDDAHFQPIAKRKPEKGEKKMTREVSIGGGMGHWVN